LIGSPLVNRAMRERCKVTLRETGERTEGRQARGAAKGPENKLFLLVSAGRTSLQGESARFAPAPSTPPNNAHTRPRWS